MKYSLFRIVMAITCFTIVQVSVANPIADYNFTKIEVDESVEIRAGSVGAIKIPVIALAKAKIASVDGVVVSFENGSHFSLSTIRDDQVGFKGVDMRNWPQYILGVKSKGSEPASFIEQAIKAGEVTIQNQIDPKIISKFETEKGIGYIAIGEQQAVIFIVDNDQPNIIAQITTTKMSEKDIQTIIINGVIK
ncbi:hypothetical protein A9Q81_16880 [Gammaproteobacteria bacterium 42_54_T18]|nr:hypothetical protein A9Q81_16880 [Gammaproteobacteria bacterium 42_54_T18]